MGEAAAALSIMILPVFQHVAIIGTVQCMLRDLNHLP
jgi:hypothetical protein